ncbi:MAG: hypothetical protein SNG69_05525 [Rikenellaceae bacterium]
MDEKKTVTFNIEDRMRYGAVTPDGNDVMAVISGYDLNIAFNLKTINSLADAEATADALAQVFYELLLENLIENKSHIVKPPEQNSSTLNKG